MTISNADILARLDSAFKSITEVSSLGDSVLQPAKQAAFVREMQLATRLLPAARRINMQAKQHDIDRIAISGRIIRSGKSSSGTHRSLGESDYVEAAFSTNTLLTNELVAIISLRDDTLRENIERGRLEDTLIAMFGEAAGRDFEEFALFSDTDIPYATDDVLSKTDGWISTAGNKLYGRQTSTSSQVEPDFDPAAASYPENVFQAQLEALPKRYFSNPADWRFYVPWEVEDAYRDLLRSRGTDLGDRSQTQRLPVYYKGIEVDYVPMLERSPTVDTGNDSELITDVPGGAVSILVNPNNLVWGVFHQVQIEPEREAKERRTDFVLTFEADAKYEDENAVVAAMIDKANPAEA